MAHCVPSVLCHFTLWYFVSALCFQSKDICIQLQDGLLKVTTELQTVSEKPTTQKTFSVSKNKQKENIALSFCAQAWRTYYQYHSDYVSAEGKLKEAEKQEEKQKQSAAKKLERLIEKVNHLLCSIVNIHVYICLFHLLLIIDHVP